MTITQVIKYYGSAYKAAIALGVTRQVLSSWKKKENVPLLQQYRYERLTAGKLTVRDEMLKIQLNKQKNREIQNERTGSGTD